MSIVVRLYAADEARRPWEDDPRGVQDDVQRVMRTYFQTEMDGRAGVDKNIQGRGKYAVLDFEVLMEPNVEYGGELEKQVAIENHQHALQRHIKKMLQPDVDRVEVDISVTNQYRIALAELRGRGGGALAIQQPGAESGDTRSKGQWGVDVIDTGQRGNTPPIILMQPPVPPKEDKEKPKKGSQPEGDMNLGQSVLMGVLGTGCVVLGLVALFQWDAIEKLRSGQTSAEALMDAGYQSMVLDDNTVWMNAAIENSILYRNDQIELLNDKIEEDQDRYADHLAEVERWRVDIRENYVSDIETLSTLYECELNPDKFPPPPKVLNPRPPVERRAPSPIDDD